MLPNFLIIGAMKAGTTSLYQYLRQHPQVFMAEPKELNFFTGRKNWDLGINWYQAHFREAASGVVAIGEASPIYSNYPELPDVPARIAAMLPHVRLIYLVRNPVDRVISEYLHGLLMGYHRNSIERALSMNPGYINRSRYSMQIERYLEHFPREQLLIVKSEDLRNVREKALQRVYAFLGVDSNWLPPSVDQEFHRTSGKRTYQLSRSVQRLPLVRATRGHVPRFLRQPIRAALESVGQLASAAAYRHRRAEISPDIARYLREQVHEDVSRLRQYMGEDFDGWGIG